MQSLGWYSKNYLWISYNHYLCTIVFQGDWVFYCILLYFIVFYCILLCFILFYFILFFLFYFILFHFISFHFISFHFILWKYFFRKPPLWSVLYINTLQYQIMTLATSVSDGVTYWRHKSCHLRPQCFYNTGHWSQFCVTFSLCQWLSEKIN